MSAQEIIDQIKALSPDDRAKVADYLQGDDSWIPESFKKGMEAASQGRFVDMETALHETPPTRLK